MEYTVDRVGPTVTVSRTSFSVSDYKKFEGRLITVNGQAVSEGALERQELQRKFQQFLEGETV